LGRIKSLEPLKLRVFGLLIARLPDDNCKAMPQDQLRTAIDALRARLQDELEAQLTSFTERQEQAIDEARRAAETETEQRWTAKVDAVRAEWAARLETEVAGAKGEAERRFVAEVARLRAEAERATVEAGERARMQAEQAAAQARTAAEQASAQAIARVRGEAEQAAAQLAEKARVEAEQAAALVSARIRAEVEQATAVVAARVRDEADQEIESERQRGIALLDAERERSSADLDAERQRASAALDAERQRVEAERQAERQRHEADRLSERQRFDAERQQFRTERQRFEIERQQFALERDRLTAELEETETTRSRGGQIDADLQRLEAELAAEREQMHELNDALRGANESLRRVEGALEQERQGRASDAAAQAQSSAAAATALSVTQARAAERDLQLAAVERLFGAMRAMDQATSLTAILGALVEAAAAEAPRAALFIASGDHLQGWKALGFTGVEIANQRLSAGDDGLLSLVMDRGEAVATSEDQGVASPGFAALPPGRAAIGVPLAIAGEPVAVLYADDGGGGDQPAPAPWPEAVQILASHAASCLAHVTATRTAQAMRFAGGDAVADDESSAKRYARLLVSEIKLYNEGAVRVGRENRDLLSRLRGEIERARRLYEERVPAEAGHHASYFHQELVQTLADGDAALLGEPA
jgi:hypothetical protein